MGQNGNRTPQMMGIHAVLFTHPPCRKHRPGGRHSALRGTTTVRIPTQPQEGPSKVQVHWFQSSKCPEPGVPLQCRVASLAANRAAAPAAGAPPPKWRRLADGGGGGASRNRRGNAGTRSTSRDHRVRDFAHATARGASCSAKVLKIGSLCLRTPTRAQAWP